MSIPETVTIQDIIKDFITIQNPCTYCKDRNVFGYREKNTKCNCKMDDFIKDIIKWFERAGVIIEPDSNYKQIIESVHGQDYRPNCSDGWNFIDIVCELDKVVEGCAMHEYLDIGCGDMRFTNKLSTFLGVYPQGIDVKDYTNSELGDLGELTLYDGEILPFPGESFRIITCKDTLHHVKNPDILIESVYNTLQDGGVFVIREHDCRSWSMMYSLGFLHSVLSEISSEEKCVTSYRSRQGWRNACIRQGFTLLEEFCENPMNSYASYTDTFIKIEEFEY